MNWDEVYDYLAPAPGTTYGSLVPLAKDDKTGAVRFAMPDSVRSGVKGMVDLLRGTETGKLTPDALASITFGGLGVGATMAPRGVIGIFGGPLARNADLSALQEAKHQLAGGKWPGEVWNATNWGKGVDGKWRFEINDQQAAYTKPKIRPEGNSLPEVLDHPSLYEAYPDLRKVRVHWSDLSGPNHTGAALSNGDIVLNNILWADPRRARLTLLHEVQHLVQNREGFANGQSSSVGRDAYHRSAGEVEARNVEARADFGAWQRREDPPGYTQDVPDEKQIVDALRKYGLMAPAPFGLAPSQQPLPNGLRPADQREY